MLVMAVQREWNDDPKGQVKLVAYKSEGQGMVGGALPARSAAEGGWMGLSEITAHNGKLYIVERDNLDRRRSPR